MMGIWYHFIIMFEALFILTTVDAGTRVLRCMIQDLIGNAIPAFRKTESLVNTLIGSGLAVLLWGTNAAAGHAGAGYLWPVWTGITAVHLAATATWLAGLTALAVVLLRRTPPRAGRDRTLLRWSAVATVAVVLLIGTGTAQSLRSINDLGELTATPYGRLLLIKLGLVAAMLLLALFGRTWVRRTGSDLSVLRRSVSGELALGVVVIEAALPCSSTALRREWTTPTVVSPQL